MTSRIEALIEQLEGRLRTNPSSRTFSRLADSYRKAGDIPRAISICSEGIQHHPGCTTGRIILGRCYLEQENLTGAVEEFTRVCQLDRHNHVALKMLADIFSKQNMREKAGDLYAILLRMDPLNPSLIHLCSVFQGTGKSDVFQIINVQGPSVTEEEAAVAAPEGTTDETVVSDMADGGTEQGFTLEDMTAGADLSFADQATAAESGIDTLSEILSAGDGVAGADMQTEVEGQESVDSDISQTMSFEDTADSALQTDQPVAEMEISDDGGADATTGITGDDITSRMETMFGQGQSRTVSRPPEPQGADSTDIAEEAGKVPPAPAQHRESRDDAGRVTGRDISQRLDEMFGETFPAMQAAGPSGPSEDVGIEDFSQLELPSLEEPVPEGPEPEERIDLMSDSPTKEIRRQDLMDAIELAEKQETPPAAGRQEAPPAPVPQPMEEWGEEILDEETSPGTIESDIAGIISGDDVSTRIDDLLGETGIQEKAPPRVQSADSTAEMAAAGTIPGGKARRPEKQGPPQEPPAPSHREEADFTDAVEPAAPSLSADASPVSGEDIVGRIDEMFGSDAFGIDRDIPEGEGSDEAVGEFYTVSGGAAGSDNQEAEVLEQLESQGEDFSSVEIPPPAESSEAAAQTEETVDAEPSRPELSVQEIAEVAEEIGEDMEISSAGEALVGGKPVETADVGGGEISVEEAAPLVEDRIEQAPDADEGEHELVSLLLPVEETLDEIPDEDSDEDEHAGENFYTVSGDHAGDSAPGEDVMATIEELAAEPQPAEPVPAAEDDARSEVADAGDIDGETDIQSAFHHEPAPPSSSPVDIDIPSIPDHVLTPTLADIYFQQGQPQLASQIYRRLLERDPENERIMKRLREIEESGDTFEAGQSEGTGAAMRGAAQVFDQKRHDRHKKATRVYRRRGMNEGRPLTGVRIKKKIKDKIRKSRNRPA